MSTNTTWLIQGVVTGITIAALVGLFGWLREKYREWEQTRFVRNLLEDRYRSILNAGEIKDGDLYASIDRVRLTVFQELLRRVEYVLQYRSSSLHYKKVHDLQRVYTDVRSFMQMLNVDGPQVEKHPQGMRLYEQHFFGPLQELEWLQLDLSNR